MVISPKLTQSAFDIPNSPQYVSSVEIEKITNIYILKQLEYEYDTFLENKCQILLLLGLIDEVFEIRNSIILRINILERAWYRRKNQYDKNFVNEIQI